MIQIKRNNLDDLAQIHCDSIKPFVKKKLNKLSNNNKSYKYINENLDKILKGKPEELTEIIEKIGKLTPRETTKIALTFNYKSFYNGEYNAYFLAKALNVKTCPYCNRQYTFTIYTKEGKTRPEFDHFFCQSKYPYLALSFYNLIPCCHICNSNFKNKKIFSISKNVNPYIEGFGNNMKFRINIKNIEFFYGNLDSFDLKLKVDTPTTELQTKANKNIDCFKLEELYNQHKDYAIEIVEKAIIYSDDYIESLKTIHKMLFKNQTPEDIKRIVFGNYLEEDMLDKRVLSKLTKDIVEEVVGMKVI